MFLWCCRYLCPYCVLFLVCDVFHIWPYPAHDSVCEPLLIGARSFECRFISHEADHVEKIFVGNMNYRTRPRPGVVEAQPTEFIEGAPIHPHERAKTSNPDLQTKSKEQKRCLRSYEEWRRLPQASYPCGGGQGGRVALLSLR